MSTVKYNQLYNNPALTRAFSNIANTLVGSASDDAATARANYLRSQTEGQNIKNKNMVDFRNSIEPTTNVISNNILRSFTGQPNAQFNQSGVPIVDGGNMSMPVSGNTNVMPPADMTKENYSNVARTMLGDLTFKPNQFASALNTLGTTEREKLAQNLITSGNPDDRRAGFSLLGKSPGAYFDAGSAKYATDKKTEVGMNKNQLDAKVKKEIGLDKNQKVFDIAKYKFDNRDISIAVGKDKQVFLDKATGKKLGIPPQTINGEEVYVLDGKQSPNKVVVKVGKSDVYLNKETADALGVPKNSDGKYVIKGKGFADGSGGGSGGSGGSGIKGNIIKIFDTEFKKYADYEKFPGKNKTKFQKILQQIVESKLQNSNESFQQVFLKEVSPIIGMGTTEITEGTNFFIPTYFFENFAKQLANGRPAVQIQKDLQDDLGYSEDQAKRAIEQMLGG